MGSLSTEKVRGGRGSHDNLMPSTIPLPAMGEGRVRVS